MLSRVSVITLGSRRKAVSPKPRMISIGKASYGGVSTRLVSYRNGSVVKNRSTFASRPGIKPGTTHRVGMMGTARAGGNPRTALHTRHALGNRVTSHGKVHSSGVRVCSLSVAGTRSYSSRGMLGSQRRRKVSSVVRGRYTKSRRGFSFS